VAYVRMVKTTLGARALQMVQSNRAARARSSIWGPRTTKPSWRRGRPPRGSCWPPVWESFDLGAGGGGVGPAADRGDSSWVSCGTRCRWLSAVSRGPDRLDHQAVQPDRAATAPSSRVGDQILTAEDPLTPGLRDARALIC
jgi:hypothetical protein